MSEISRKLLLMQIDGLNNEIKARGKNLTDWTSLFNRLSIFKNKKWEIENIDLPYLAVVTFSSSDEASSVFNTFVRKSIPVSTWPDLAPEVLSQPEKYKSAISLRNRRIFFPVHSSVDVQSIKLNSI